MTPELRAAVLETMGVPAGGPAEDRRHGRGLMLVLGLTGSAAMGKSTAAGMFAEAGVPVFDADRTVHRLYRGAAAPVVEAAFPGTTANGAVDRDRLRDRVLGDEAAMARLEALVHPLVRAERDGFLKAGAAAGRHAVLLDIPLLFETGAEGDVDAVIVVDHHARHPDGADDAAGRDDGRRTDAERRRHASRPSTVRAPTADPGRRGGAAIGGRQLDNRRIDVATRWTPERARRWPTSTSAPTRPGWRQAA